MGKHTVEAIWGAIIFIGAGIIVFVAVFHPMKSNVPAENASGTNMATSSAADAPTHTDAPTDVVAPSEGSKGVTADIAVPAIQVAASPDSTASFREFLIKVAHNAYSPNTVIVNQGDTVDLEITATDGDYGFNQPDYGLSSSIPKGRTQKIGFQALESGKFTFYCASCGGPTKGPVGYLVVTPKS